MRTFSMVPSDKTMCLEVNTASTTLVVPNVEMIRGLNLPGTPRACRGIPLLYSEHTDRQTDTD